MKLSAKLLKKVIKEAIGDYEAISLGEIARELDTLAEGCPDIKLSGQLKNIAAHIRADIKRGYEVRKGSHI